MRTCLSEKNLLNLVIFGWILYFDQQTNLRTRTSEDAKSSKNKIKSQTSSFFRSPPFAANPEQEPLWRVICQL
jgi:hypothetical protein